MMPIDDPGVGIEIPWSREAEQSVLGGLLLDNTAWDRAGALLQPQHFFDHRHGMVFGAIGSLITATKPADVITVFERLQSLRQADECGGMAYLNAMAQSVPSAANMRRYAEIVRERADQRALITAADTAMSIARETGPVADKLDRICALLGQLERQQVRKAPRSLAAILVERLDHINELGEGKRAPGWPTRIPWLDKVLNGGLLPGRLYGIAARPSVGKSSLAEAIGLTLAGHELPTLLLSQEMPDVEVADRAVASIGRLDYEQLQTGQLAGDDWGRLSEAVEQGARLPFYVDDQPALRLTDIRAKARMVKGLKVLIIDYLQLCAGSGGKDNRNAEIEEITRGLKALAKDMNIAVIVLSQLNREVEKRANKRPNLGDLRDSGAIEQDLDVVMFLWPVRELEAEGRRIIGLEVAKNRQGKRGEIGLDFFGATQRWGESTADIRPVAAQPARREVEFE
jgi:replicative DNA helicase